MSQLALPSLYLENMHAGPIPSLEPSVHSANGRAIHFEASTELLEAQWARHNVNVPDIEIPVAANVRLLRDSAGRLCEF